MVDWTYTIRGHMLKAKTLTNFKLPYVVLISKFIEHFGVDVEGKIEESIVEPCFHTQYAQDGFHKNT